MKTSTTTAVIARRRPSPPGLMALVAAALLLPACVPAPTSQPSAPMTAGSGQSTAQAGGPTPGITPAAETPAPGPATSRASVPAPVPAAPATLPAPTVPVPAPTTLTVAGTTINMTVVPVGVAAGGAMEIPGPFDQAGWYRFGPAPGADAGTAVIAGHIDTTSDQAPFSQLKSLAAGTAIQVGRQDAPPLVYRVVSVELMAKDRFDGDALFRRAGPHELKVVTCGGRWLDEVKDYSDNVIVTAVLE
ncbi:class F sortase [Pseudarthrobacter sp. DSP2-3-2b1]|uniref:class F sortase n=1 Tax=Pseudarthrobacter sp. DSP2-3-2b1 TaxID=2804661 RepID=UPI003CE8DBCA